MRRLLLPFVLVAAAAVPASAQDQICAGVKTRGSVPPNTETQLWCQTVPYPGGMYCEYGTEGVHPDAWLEHHYCGPTIIPLL